MLSNGLMPPASSRHSQSYYEVSMQTSCKHQRMQLLRLRVPSGTCNRSNARAEWCLEHNWRFSQVLESPVQVGAAQDTPTAPAGLLGAPVLVVVARVTGLYLLKRLLWCVAMRCGNTEGSSNLKTSQLQKQLRHRGLSSSRRVA